jgi:hypothetical protein
LNTNRITAITDTIINCTSLLNLRLTSNQLTLIPTIPNSVRQFWIAYNYLDNNSISNLPNSLVDFDASGNDGTALGLNSGITQWNFTLTSYTSLTKFYMNNCNLSGWTTQFPSSIRDVQFSANKIPSFDIDLVNGATSLYLNGMPTLTGLTNLSSNSTISNLQIQNCGFTALTNIFTTTLPSSLTILNMSFVNVTGSTWPTNAFSNINLGEVRLRRCGLNSTSIDNIINDIYATTTVSNGDLILGPNAGSSISTPNESRSSASQTAYDALIAAGWTITLP